MSNERLPKPSKAIERYVSPTPMSNPDVAHGLVRSGLSLEFPAKLRGLNDALAEYRSQFAGLKITLAPAMDDPAPMVEVKRGPRNFVTIDIDADPFEPERSKGRLTIQANNGEGAILEFQKHANVVALLKEISGDKKYSLTKVGTISGKVEELVDDFSEFDFDRIDPKTVATTKYFVHERGDRDNPVLHLGTALGFGTASMFWTVAKVDFRGFASEIEATLPVLAEFFKYNPHEDPEIFPDLPRSEY